MGDKLYPPFQPVSLTPSKVHAEVMDVLAVHFPFEQILRRETPIPLTRSLVKIHQVL